MLATLRALGGQQRDIRLLAMTALLMIGAVGKEHRPWSFVRDVGGLALGVPYRTADGVMLPIAIDISGLRTISVAPKTMNSGLALAGISVEHHGGALFLSVMTAPAGPGTTTTAKDVPLGGLTPGRYLVNYLEPDGSSVEIGAVIVPP